MGQRRDRSGSLVILAHFASITPHKYFAYDSTLFSEIENVEIGFLQERNLPCVINYLRMHPGVNLMGCTMRRAHSSYTRSRIIKIISTATP
jgi:hypothetical protein